MLSSLSVIAGSSALKLASSKGPTCAPLSALIALFLNSSIVTLNCAALGSKFSAALTFAYLPAIGPVSICSVYFKILSACLSVADLSAAFSLSPAVGLSAIPVTVSPSTLTINLSALL